MDKQHRFYVAGHKGMVGSAIVRALKNDPTFERNSILLTATREELDLTRQSDVRSWFEQNKPSTVIIAAAKVGGIYANNTYPYDFLAENLKIEINLIQEAFNNKADKLVFLGSSCIYPKLAEQPIREEYLLNGELEKTNEWYAIAKIAGIKLCDSLRLQHKFNAISLMPTNLYGPGDNYHSTNSHVMPAMIKRFDEAVKNKLDKVVCWGSGEPKREFLHVDDLATAVIHSLKYWNPDDLSAPKHEDGSTLGYLNVGTGKDISINSLANLIADQMGYKGEIVWDKSKPDGTPRKVLDVSRLKSLGWSAKINLETGLESTIKDYQSKGSLRN